MPDRLSCNCAFEHVPDDRTTKLANPQQLKGRVKLPTPRIEPLHGLHWSAEPCRAEGPALSTGVHAEGVHWSALGTGVHAEGVH